jgi:hypothetical protein
VIFEISEMISQFSRFGDILNVSQPKTNLYFLKIHRLMG